MAQGTLAPTPILIAQDANGAPVSGAKAYFYLAGTSTPAPVYTDVGLLVAHQVPVVANGFGRFPEIFLSPGASYKLDMTTPAGVSLSGYPADYISAVPAATVNIDVTGTAGEALTAGQVVYLSDGSGSKTAGQWFKADSGQTYSCLTALVGIVPAAIAAAASGTIRLGGQITGLSALIVGTTYYVGAAGALTSTAPTLRRELGKADTTSSLVLEPWPTKTAPASNHLCQGRLTLTTGTPVTTADVQNATNVFFSPYGGNRISLYDGIDTWNVRTFSELTLALGTLVNAQGYDVFAYDNAGVVAVEMAEWANAVVTMTIAAPTVITWTAHGMTTGQSVTLTSTGALPTGITANTQYWITTVDANSFKISTSPANVAAGTFIAGTVSQSGVHTAHQPQARATALALQDGVLSKSGALTRRYLGSFLTTATTTTEDSAAKRFVWNYYLRKLRPLRVIETSNTWAYSTATLRQANGSAANQLAIFVGVAEVMIEAAVQALASNNTAATAVTVAIGEDSTTTALAGSLMGSFTVAVINANVAPVASLRTSPSIGYHAYVWLEYSAGGGTSTWYGDNGGPTNIQSGMVGSIEG